MKIARWQVRLLWNVFNEISKNRDGNIKFFYAIEKNKRIIHSEIETIIEIEKPIEELSSNSEYDKDRISIVIKYAKKDTDGKIITKQLENNQIAYEFDEPEVVLKEIMELQNSDKYKSLFEKQIEKNKEFNSFMNELIEIEFYRIRLSDIPASMKPDYISILFDLIEE